MHPLVIISHNNHAYVANTIAQATAFGLRTIVLDNASTYERTRDYLRSIEAATEVRYLPDNFGSTCWSRVEIYDDLPDRFFLTDPDLRWNPRLPYDFPAQLDALSTKFCARSVGFALDISDREAMHQEADYFCGKSIWDWESQFWLSRIPHGTHALYAAAIDTTFQLRDKRGGDLALRVAGDFTAKHLPWYRETRISPHDLLHMYGTTSVVSTTSRLVMRQMKRTGILKHALAECEASCSEPVKFAASTIKEPKR